LKKKWIPFILIIIMAIVILLIKNAQRDETLPSSTKTTRDPASSVNRNHGFDRRTDFLEYTQHAKCRMDCRKISDAEVREIMEAGTINYRKSNVKGRPCPSYALEGRTMDNQRVRIVFGQCDKTTKVITVIDLDTEWTCACPGDDDKSKTRN
jgi:hypothetical protein